ncbi:MAG: small subunit ribosomal protein S20 [Candidatus Saganbacteria bacterium]|uniref:Small ribosomal subunit protein bS20 n=1 Tax=Candidatus Saganbacteria bacterium TaxID=2575572 RepID=A0A833L2W0_UNCSA|nr:MAG: small subunit ribosomal protein S20 [Candidatus Saganbacteria bacterium]
MANTKSAQKRILKSKRNRTRNLKYKGNIKKLAKDFKSFISKSKEEAGKALNLLVSAIDKAALKGVIHKNKAARQKSKFQKRFNSK